MAGIPRDFIAFDLETTGFAPPCKIIEIGAVKVINSKIVDRYQTFVDPCCMIPPRITGLTGIDQTMVCKAPKIDDALPLFINFIESLPIAAHNASFDMNFINYEARRLGYPVKNRIIDTLALSRRYYPALENHKLNTVARHIGVINECEHRGLYDAMVVAGILMKLSSENMQAG
jgi:DNA polymerase-3 subunit alpha (Gram-positive type)